MTFGFFSIKRISCVFVSQIISRLLIRVKIQFQLSLLFKYTYLSNKYFFAHLLSASQKLLQMGLAYKQFLTSSLVSTRQILVYLFSRFFCCFIIIFRCSCKCQSENLFTPFFFHCEKNIYFCASFLLQFLLFVVVNVIVKYRFYPLKINSVLS